MNIDDLTYKINGAIFEVNKILGAGFLEKVYENALLVELRNIGLKCKAQVPIEVIYKDELVGDYFADIVVEDLVILELKAIDRKSVDRKSTRLNSSHLSVSRMPSSA